MVLKTGPRTAIFMKQIGNYFMRILKKDSLNMIRKIEVGLLEMENESSILLEQVNNIHRFKQR